MTEKSFTHLNAGYVSQATFEDGTVQQQIELKPAEQGTADKIAAHIASGKTLYLTVRKIENGKEFPAEGNKPAKKTLAFVGLSQKTYDSLA